MVCKRCGEMICESESCVDYGCVHCCCGNLTYSIDERQRYIAAKAGVYDSRKDSLREYECIWPADRNEPVMEAAQ